MVPIRPALLSAALLLVLAPLATAASLDPGGPCRPSCAALDACEPWCLLTAHPAEAPDPGCLTVGTDLVAPAVGCLPGPAFTALAAAAIPAGPDLAGIDPGSPCRPGC